MYGYMVEEHFRNSDLLSECAPSEWGGPDCSMLIMMVVVMRSVSWEFGVC